MGHSPSAIHSSTNSSLNKVVKRAESRAGHISVSGRYHLPPKKLEDDYVVEPKVLGTGYNGEVFMASSKANNADLKYAVKSFRFHGASKEKRQALENEAEIFLSLDHPHVARLVDVYETEDRLDLVMECMEGGELFDRVNERKRCIEQDAAEAVWQMLLAINYIHSHHVVHRDLKLENFLYEKKDSDHLKLIDFGFSKIWDTNTKMALSCGTLPYVAPEVLEKKYTDQCDMWSLGVITFILLVGYMPFAGSEAHQLRCIKEAKYKVCKDAWKKVSDVAFDFVKKLLVVNPDARLTSANALEHPWVKDRHNNFKDHHHVDQDVVNAMVNFSHASQFRRACMSVMAWSLTNEERTRVRDAFLELDTKREGTVKMWEFKQVLEDQFHIDHDEVVSIFEKMNTSHDEEIHYTEFLSAMVSSRIQLHDDLLKSTFRRFDTHNTGYITAADLKEVLGESFEGEDITSMLEEAHIEQDGKISLSDFMWYLKHPEADAEHHEAAHKVIDTLTRKGSSSNALNPTDGQGPDRGGFMKTKTNGSSDDAATPALPADRSRLAADALPLQCNRFCKAGKKALTTLMALGGIYAGQLVTLPFMRRLLHLVPSKRGGLQAKAGRRAQSWITLVMLHWMYLSAVFDVLLFRSKEVSLYFPKVAKLLTRVGVDTYILADQSQPCEKSHPGVSCTANALKLYRKWFAVVPASMLASQLLLTALLRPSALRSFSLLRVSRLIAFLFGSSGLPGFAFCLTKKLSPEGRGSRMGSLSVALLGALSVFAVPVDVALKLVNGLYVSTAASLAVYKFQRLRGDHVQTVSTNPAL